MHTLNLNMRKPLRVLMQTRPNVFAQRGGDTIVLERISQGLQTAGIDVVVDATGEVSPQGFDLVHLFNFATPGITGPQAQRAKDSNVPYVVTTLYEDTPRFHTQSHYVAIKLIEYVRTGQRRDSWQMSYQELGSITPSGRFPVDSIAQGAAALLPNGDGEAQALRRDFPRAQLVEVVPLGSEVGACEGPELFEQTYGLRDFVLCVGRLESRKNQLMLLKALEDSEFSVVLAAGGFSYQPEYEQAIRSFKRKGKTIVLGHLDPKMLSSAYAACRIHVLPSWYELPGLVSLEAAAHNKNLVVTRTGTTADYLRDVAYYCSPWDSDSIRSAVMAAYYAPTHDGLIEMARGFSWAESVRCTIEVYKKVVTRGDWLLPDGNSVGAEEPPPMSHGEYDMSLDATQFLDILERGEAAAKSADFEAAQLYLTQAEALEPNSTRVLKAQGAVLLAQSRPDEARVIFDRALRVDPRDPKLLAGRGMCDLLRQKPDVAMPFFERALEQAPDYLVALHQLLECSYGLCTYDSVLKALNTYLSLKPEDTDIRFCLAGCLFKSGRSQEAEVQLSNILTADPLHIGAKELRNIIRAGVDGCDSRQPVKESSSDQVVPGFSGAELRDSLSELSERIRTWTVKNAPTPPTQAQVSPPRQEMPRETADAEFGTAVGQIEDLKRAGEFEAALKKLATLMERKDMPPQYREVAECLQAEFTVLGGDLRTSARMYDEIIRRNPQAARALCGKGAIAAEVGDWSVAEEYFRHAREADADCDVAYAGLGLCAMVAHKTENAFALFSTAVEKNPENNRALLGVLQTGYPLKRYTEMERMLTAFLDLHPANLDILYSFAGVLFAQGKVKEARIEIEKILLFAPEHEHALELRGMIDQSASTEPRVQ